MATEREIISYLAIILLGLILAQHLNVVVSGSMEPVFYRGDVVIIEKTNFMGFSEMDAEDLKIGDIIIYDATWFAEPVIHRIVGIKQGSDGKKYYITKGDNNSNADPALVSGAQVKAKVITIGNHPLVIPKIGYITLLIRGL
ncbi:MAG: signal peptidase I [Euryarchaeota archaeon]|uniref:signal peptidase I n=1 Tax=Methanobacterium sp. MZD130B TaxID=3394378 RepID=UPI001753FE75|nr:signal peptidase I [Euryarchaeota archaeon]HHT19764.1 signal peptidase I [Methanobacterium sp.]